MKKSKISLKEYNRILEENKDIECNCRLCVITFANGSVVPYCMEIWHEIKKNSNTLIDNKINCKDIRLKSRKLYFWFPSQKKENNI